MISPRLVNQCEPNCLLLECVHSATNHIQIWKNTITYDDALVQKSIWVFQRVECLLKIFNDRNWPTFSIEQMYLFTLARQHSLRIWYKLFLLKPIWDTFLLRVLLKCKNKFLCRTINKVFSDFWNLSSMYLGSHLVYA